MHGLIFAELRKFAEAGFGKEAWHRLLVEAGLPPKIYLQGETYPDEELVALATAASRVAQRPVTALLEQFGEFIVPDLFDIYGAFIQKQWKTLDMIEHTEANIHRAVRLRNPSASPPELKCQRVSPAEVVIVYNSPRKMCAVARGIVAGVARRYQEQVTISESTCMHRGDPSCTISVLLA